MSKTTTDSAASAVSASSLLEIDVVASQGEDSVWQHLEGVEIARMLAATSAGRRSHAEHVNRLAAIKRLKSWVAAAEFEQLTQIAGVQERVALVEVDGRRIAMHDAAVAEIALATRSSESEVRRDLATARMIEQSLPQIKDALVSGTVNEQQARTIARAAERVPEAMRRDVGAALLPETIQSNAQVLRGKAERVIAAIDPDGAADRRERAALRRSVWVHDEEDGNSLLCARLATVDAHACLRVINAHVSRRRSAELSDRSRPLPGTTAPGMQAANTLVDLLLSHGAQSPVVVSADGEILEGPATSGNAASLSATVFVAVDLNTLLGLNDALITVDGHADAPVQQLHDLLHRANSVEFRRVVTEPVSGRVLDIGRQSYRPPVEMVRHVRARDGCCQWLGGCDVPADRCDIDHMDPFDSGGATATDNLIALCRWHHLLKTFHGFQPTRNADGSVHWKQSTGTSVGKAS